MEQREREADRRGAPGGAREGREGRGARDDEAGEETRAPSGAAGRPRSSAAGTKMSARKPRKSETSTLARRKPL
jgi:hypothetical protein